MMTENSIRDAFEHNDPVLLCKKIEKTLILK